MLPDSKDPILFFDGVCNLCNAYVQYIIKIDKKQHFKFASLQSDAGEQLQQHVKNNLGFVPDSVILLYKGQYYLKSDAVLKAAGILGGIYKIMHVGYILPRALRNSIYNFVAKRRYKWFGKKDECMVPTPELQSRFLD